MNETNDLNLLVLDTLYNRHAERGSSIQSNPDGNQLVKCDATALGVIETVLQTVVNPELKNTDPQYFEFPGLDYVLGSLIVIGIKHDEKHLMEYLRRAPATLIAKVLGTIPGFFYNPYGKFNFDVAPTRALLDFVLEQQESRDENIRNEALKVHRLLSRRIAQQHGITKGSNLG